MNELQNVVNVENIRGYVDQTSGVVFLNLEDVAYGLGFTETKPNGAVYIITNRVRKYLQNLGFDTSVENFGQCYIPENIFYRLSMKANNKTATAFQERIANDILPMIRRTGIYMTDEAYNAFVSNPRNIANIMTLYADARDQIREMQPKVEQYDTFMNSNCGFNMATVSKMLCFQAPQRKKKVIGRNQMFQILRELNILQSTSDNWNLPYQDYIDMGYFRVLARNGNSGRSHAKIEILPLGIAFIYDLLLANGYELVHREPLPMVYDNLTEAAM